MTAVNVAAETMHTVLVLGATGATGLRVAKRLAERGDRVRGLHRQPAQAQSLRDLGIEPVAGDLATMTAEQLEGCMQGCDTVVYAAGSSENSTDAETDAIDGHGLALAVAAASTAGAHRFLHISAFPDAGRGKALPPGFEHYMKVKRQADVHVADSSLDWVILRPGTLTNDPGQGRVRIGMAIPYGEVTRDDVAATLVELVHSPGISRVILEITGGDLAIAEALSRAVGVAARG